MASANMPVETVLTAHRERLCTQLDDMRKNNVMCDVTVVCDTTEFTAHKVILTASSTFFHNKFTDNISRLQIPEVGPDIMETILSFVYTGHILIVDNNNISSILAASHHLRITNLYHWCREYIINGLTLEKLDNVWDIADFYSDPYLQSQVAQYAAKNFKKLVKNGAFLDLPAERLIAMIGNDELVKPHHDDVLKEVFNWVNHDSEKRQRILPDIIPHIKFNKLSARFLNSLDRHPTVMASMELQQAVTKTMAMRYQRKNGFTKKAQTAFQEISSVDGLPNSSNSQFTENMVVEDYNTIENGSRNLTDIEEFPNESLVKLNDNFTTHVDTYAAGKDTLRPMEYDSLSPVKRMSVKLTNPTVLLTNSISMQNFIRGFSDSQSFNNQEPILVVLGQDKNDAVVIQYFTLRSKQWGPTYRTAVQKKFASIIAHKGLVYIIGGKVNKKPTSSVHVCDVQFRQTRSVSNMNVPRCGMGVAELDGLIYVVGGYNKAGWLKDVECYDSVTNTWEPVSPLCEGKEGVGVVTAGGKLYAIGGVPVPTTEVYNPITDQWTKLERMRHARVYHGISALEGLLYVIGGFGHYPDRIQCFDYEKSKWNVMSSRAPQQCRDTWCAAAAWNNHILVINSEGLLWDFDSNLETWTKLPSSYSLVGGYISGFISVTVVGSVKTHRTHISS